MRKVTFIFLVLFIISALMPFNGLAEEEFVIGLIPEENIFIQIRKHKPLADYLSDSLGVKVRFTILSRYPDIIDRFVTREMDGAFFGIFTGILAEEKLGVVPVARPVRNDGDSTANSYIFSRKDSGINSASDMKGKSAVFVDKATATGYLYLLAYLRENGVRNINNYFSEYTFIGSHDSSIYSVLSGRAAIGVAKGRILEKLSKKDPLIKEELNIIAKSENLPDITLCVRPGISPDLKSRMRNTLLTMHQNSKGREVLKTLEVKEFIAAEKDDFKRARKLAKKAGITDLKNFDYK